MMTIVAQIARACFAFMVLLLVGSVGWAVLLLPEKWNGLSFHVAARLDASGAHNPVTAVLLNFRGYDTLLEISVLLVAALGARAFVADRKENGNLLVTPPGAVLMGLLRLIAPVIVVVAGYFLWVGGHAPGGAFQAGAVLSSLAVLILLSNPKVLPRIPDWVERALLSVGLFIFVGVGLAVMALGESLLQYPEHQAKWLILTVEAACTVSIAMILATLFAGGKVASIRNSQASSQMEKRS